MSQWASKKKIWNHYCVVLYSGVKSGGPISEISQSAERWKTKVAVFSNHYTFVNIFYTFFYYIKITSRFIFFFNCTCYIIWTRSIHELLIIPGDWDHLMTLSFPSPLPCWSDRRYKQIWWNLAEQFQLKLCGSWDAREKLRERRGVRCQTVIKHTPVHLSSAAVSLPVLFLCFYLVLLIYLWPRQILREIKHLLIQNFEWKLIGSNERYNI